MVEESKKIHLHSLSANVNRSGVLMFRCIVLLCHLYQLQNVPLLPGWNTRMVMITYLTSWGVISQTLYNMAALAIDVAAIMSFNEHNHKSFWATPLRLSPPPSHVCHPFFRAICVPLSFTIGFIFWGLFFLNRELIFPSSLDGIVTSTMNHMQHSLPLFFSLCELVIVPHKYHGNSKKDLLMTSSLLLVYTLVLFGTRVIGGWWVYSFFGQIPLLFKPAFIFFTGLVLFCTYFVEVTVSGISSGGAMAVQFHVAHSSLVNGAAIVAGAPYYCAENTLEGALTCAQTPSLIDLDTLYAATTYAYSVGSIDSTNNLAASKVYLYSGTNDTVVNPGAMLKTEQYYLHYIPSSSIKSIFNIPSEHAFITSDFGNSCDYLGEPFINDCDYDQAGDILSYFYGPLHPAVSPVSSHIAMLNQAKFVPAVGLDAASLADNAYLYIPTNCSLGGCSMHVAFHGCEQTLTDINTTFVERAGYNRWAESNDIVVLYPQAKKTSINPKGCWDWWGYTGTNYASQLGVQIATVKNMVDYVMSKY